MPEKYLFDINEEEKSLLWDMFHREKILDDNEEMLQRELESCEKRIRTMGKPSSAIEIGIMTIYMKHARNLRKMLIKLYAAKNECTPCHTKLKNNPD